MMATSIRKQREVQEREALVLDVAREMLVQRGYLGLNMDRIAEATDYSKGTIYQHFSSKEDLLIGLAIQTMEKRVALFERAAMFSGGSRERMAAVGLADELFIRLYPHHFRSEHIIHTASVRGKSDPCRQKALGSLEEKCMGIVAGIARDAVGQGDLVLPEGCNAEELAFGLWTLSFGGVFLAYSDTPIGELGVSDAFGAVTRNCQRLLDGYGWKPLLEEWDYDQTRERIFEEMFPEERRAAGF